MLTRKMLVGIEDADYRQRQGEFGLCKNCGYELTGTRGDFFGVWFDSVFLCPDCGGELFLATKKTEVVFIEEKK